MKTDLFDYILPTFLIAQTPAPNRSESRLMQLCKNTKTITHHPFGNLPTLLNSNDVLIFNDTKVIKARLLLKKDSGASIEIVLLTPHQTTQTHPAPTLWQALI
jgi:S-adenosylmethionine:tRNA ribosyltransferase-isomerase